MHHLLFSLHKPGPAVPQSRYQGCSLAKENRQGGEDKDRPGHPVASLGTEPIHIWEDFKKYRIYSGNQLLLIYFQKWVA